MCYFLANISGIYRNQNRYQILTENPTKQENKLYLLNIIFNHINSFYVYRKQ